MIAGITLLGVGIVGTMQTTTANASEVTPQIAASTSPVSNGNATIVTSTAPVSTADAVVDTATKSADAQTLMSVANDTGTKTAANDAPESPRTTTNTEEATVNTESATLATPPVKEGVTPSATIATTHGASNQVTTKGTNFQLNFVAGAGDQVTVKIDGVDVSDQLFTNSPTNYASVKNVTKAQGQDGNVVTPTISSTNNPNGTIVEQVVADGSYVQYFDLQTLKDYLYYSPTATGYTQATVEKQIQVLINGAVAANTTFKVTYQVAPVRLLSPNYYHELHAYNANQIIFPLPNFGISNGDKKASILSLNELANLGAKTATYQVGMPTGFVLDTAATATLNADRPFTVTQDATTGDVVLTYDLNTQPDVNMNDIAAVYIQGAFTGYQANQYSVLAANPNVVTVITNDGQTLQTTSTGNDQFSYPNGEVPYNSYWYSWPKDYIGNGSSLDDYTDIQRSASTADQMLIASGTASYGGAATQNADALVEIPAGFTTTALDVEVDQHLLTVNNSETLPYQLVYTDGTKVTGTLKVGTNQIELVPGKVFKSLNYQFNLPDSPRLTNGESDAETLTQQASYDKLEPYLTLPVVHTHLTTDDGVEVGKYQVTSVLHVQTPDGIWQDISNNTQQITVLDGQTDAYLSVHATAQDQVATSAGEVLTSTTTSPLSAPAIQPVNGLTLSNGETSSSNDVVAQFLNKPIFYFIAPAQTHFLVDIADLRSRLPGAVITSYQTSTGQAAYKIDLTNAVADRLGKSGDNSYLDAEPIAVTGVFRNGTTIGYNDVSTGILERLINYFDIQANPDAKEGTDDLQIYYTTQNQVNDLSNGQDTNGALTGDANAIKVAITNPSYTIKNLSGIYGNAMIQGATDNGFSLAGETSIYSPLADNQFAVNVMNMGETDLTNVSVLINLPTKGDTFGSQFTVQLAGAPTTMPADVTALYSTVAQTQLTQTGVQPDLTGYVTADQVTDWNSVRSIYLHTDSVAAGSDQSRVIFNVQDPTQLQDVNQTAYFDSGVYADNLIPVLTTKDKAASLTIAGMATVKFAFLLPDGTQIAMPALSEQLLVGQSAVYRPLIKGADVPAGYTLIDLQGNPLKLETAGSTRDYQTGDVVNSDADYTALGGTNGLAAMGAIAHYDADGDTILIPLTAVNPQTIKVVYIDDVTKQELTTASITGAALTQVPTTFSTASQIKTYQDQGYVLVSDQTDGITLTYDDDSTQDQLYEVHLTHGTTTKTQTQTVTQRIQYVYEDGGKAAPDYNTAVTFEQTQTIDQVTGAVLKSTWAPATATFTSVESPTASNPGYTPDLGQTEAYEVTPTTGNLILTVTYAATAQRATVTYVDEDNHDAVLHTDTINGNAGETANYTATRDAYQGALEDQGYVYVRESGNALGSNNIITFDDDTTTDQATLIYLKHGITTNQQSRTVTQTIQYVYVDGGKAASDYTTTATFEQTETVDRVTNQVLKRTWTPATAMFAPVKSPAATKAGYTPDLSQTEMYPITPNTGDLTLTITYVPDAQRAIVNYVDDDANEFRLHQDVLTGVSNGQTAYAETQAVVEQQLIALGYQVVGSDLPAGSLIVFDNLPEQDQIFTVHLNHRMTPVTDQTVLQKIVTQTVTYVYDGGTTAAPTVTDQVIFTRTGMTDEVTYHTTYTAWVPVNQDTTFDVKISPIIPNYVADRGQIDQVTGLTAQSEDRTEVVTYYPDTDQPGLPSGGGETDNPGTSGEPTGENPGNPGEPTGEIPDNPGEPTGENPGNPSEPTGETPDNPGQPVEPEIPAEGNQPNQPGTTPQQPTPVATPVGTESTTQRTTNVPARTAARSANETPKTVLPQTDDASQSWLAVLGVSLLGAVGLLGTMKRRKQP